MARREGKNLSALLSFESHDAWRHLAASNHTDLNALLEVLGRRLDTVFAPQVFAEVVDEARALTFQRDKIGGAQPRPTT